MDAEMMARATYDARAARMAAPLASKYSFETPIVEVEGDYCHQLTITRLSDGVVVHQANYSSVDALDDAICDWRVQLGLSTLNAAMMGL